jgi:hypothetical protein
LSICLIAPDHARVGLKNNDLKIESTPAPREANVTLSSYHRLCFAIVMISVMMQCVHPASKAVYTTPQTTQAVQRELIVAVFEHWE